MAYVIKVIGMEGRNESSLGPADYQNKYISCIGDIERPSTWVFSSDKSRAKTFPDPLSAIAFYDQQLPNFPLRPDGKPNRPLTAFSGCIEPKHTISAAAVGTGAMKYCMHEYK